MPLLAYVSVRNVHKKGIVVVHFLLNWNKQEYTGKFMYTPSILDNKQLLSNKIDHKATQVSANVFYPNIVD